MKKIIILFLLLPVILISQVTPIQSLKSQRNNLMVYNISLGAIIGGFSELIANPRKDKPINAFLHGFCLGALGGGINGFGKIAIGEVISRGYYNLVLPTRLIHSFGTSIIYNTGHSKNPYFQYFNFDYGSIQLQVDCVNKSIIPKISPISLGGILLCIRDKSDFILGKSLLMGIPYFTNSNLVYSTRGYTYLNSMVTNANRTDSIINYTTAHEFIHVLQHFEYINMSNIAFGKFDLFVNNKKIWKFINTDLPFFNAFYGLANSFSSKASPYANYYYNFYEVEARNFANQK